jgi:hypothetical protein
MAAGAKHLAVETTSGAIRNYLFVVQVLGNLQRRHDMLVLQIDILSCRKQTGNLQNVFDLASIHVHTCKLVKLIFSDRVLLGRRFQKVTPDRLSGLDRQLLVIKRDMDARLERRVKGLYTIGREEHGALKLLVGQSY